MDILGGKLTVNQLQIESPVLQIVPTPGGGDTLTPVLQGGSPEKSTSSGPGSAPQLNIRQFTISNASIRQLSGSAGQASQTIEISRLGVTIDQLVTGQPGKLEITGDLRVDQAAQGAWNGKVDSKFDFALGANLLPSLLKGSLRAAVAQATGTFASLAGFSTSLTGDVTATDVKQLALGFEQGGKNLGTVSLSGPFVAEKREGKLKLEVAGVDRQLLGSLTAGSGFDWGETRITAQTDLDIQKGGQALKAAGNVSITGLSVTQQGRKTPTLDLSLGYDTTTDLASQTARLDSLVLKGQQDNRALVNGNLTAPMTVAWGKTAGGAADAAWQVSIDDLNLPDWRAFTGDVLT
ncbi:MAG TPA: hypothetical protein PKW90_22260, partial [Myxococcota bacterium]|nr:hypothetical protein [Myxococcota bacterium]